MKKRICVVAGVVDLQGGTHSTSLIYVFSTSLPILPTTNLDLCFVATMDNHLEKI